MTRKDYKLLAAAIHTANLLLGDNDSPDQAWQTVRNKICQTLAQDNPRFDPVKFLSACNEG